MWLFENYTDEWQHTQALLNAIKILEAWPAKLPGASWKPVVSLHTPWDLAFGGNPTSSNPAPRQPVHHLFPMAVAQSLTSRDRLGWRMYHGIMAVGWLFGQPKKQIRYIVNINRYLWYFDMWSSQVYQFGATIPYIYIYTHAHIACSINCIYSWN